MKKLIMAAIAIVILVVAFLFISPPLNRDGQSDLPDPAENSTEMPPEETAEPVFYDGVQVDENTSAIALNADSSVEELAALCIVIPLYPRILAVIETSKGCLDDLERF